MTQAWPKNIVKNCLTIVFAMCLPCSFAITYAQQCLVSSELQMLSAMGPKDKKCSLFG